MRCEFISCFLGSEFAISLSLRKMAGPLFWELPPGLSGGQAGLTGLSYFSRHSSWSFLFAGKRSCLPETTRKCVWCCKSRAWDNIFCSKQPRHWKGRFWQRFFDTCFLVQIDLVKLACVRLSRDHKRIKLPWIRNDEI